MIKNISNIPFHNIIYKVVTNDSKIVDYNLPFYLGTHLLNKQLQIIIFSDLQGRDKNGIPIGEVLCEELFLLKECGQINSFSDTLIITAGDLYSRPNLDRKGGSGDVRNIWQSYTKYYDFIIGVPGNHDLFGNSPKDFEQFRKQPKICFLDNEVTEKMNLKIAGLGGVIGRESRPFRRTEENYLQSLSKLLKKKPDILIMHDGPNGGNNMVGNEKISELIEKGEKCIVIRGHKYWDDNFICMNNGTQVINTSEKVVILNPEDK